MRRSKEHRDVQVARIHARQAVVVAGITLASTLGAAWLGGILHVPGRTALVSAQEEELLDRLRGFWTYELQNRSTGDWILGAFEIAENAGHLTVPSGHSFYAESKDGVFQDRGIWKSKAVTFEGNSLYIIFGMVSTSVRPVAADARDYSGILELDVTSSRTLNGVFHDLDIRHANWGAVTVVKTTADNMSDAIVEAQQRHQKR